MTNIWGFFLQTLSVSLVAGLLLLVKWLLGDKLSPRWQYGVWSVLALRIVLPVWSAGKYILLPLPLWLETLKGVVENWLESAYSSTYAPIRIYFPIPWISGAPESVTDWVFAAYVIGALALLLWYLVSYGRLRLLLRHGGSVSEKARRQIEAVCARYGLKPCRAVTVAGLPSAFVCGIVRPVLAIPAETEIDDKVLLHELLHLKYFDAAQSIIWCIFRALHWCNPFLLLVFDRIGNDMEALCDQRVLERLEGEQRREYGGILLSMVNARYPRAPGTTSISNGGKNIARRIAAIARFKKYPRGMALVSICIVVALLCPSLFGTYAQGLEVGGGGAYNDWRFAKAMASARVTRCTTVAGALDTYAKGIMLENGIYLAAASPLSEHKALAEKMTFNATQEHWVYYHLKSDLDDIDPNGYWVYNLKQLPDGGYEALLVFATCALTAEDHVGYPCDKDGNPCLGVIAYPVRVSREDGWVVTKNGERQVYPQDNLGQDHLRTLQFNIQYGSPLLPCLTVYKATGRSGTVTTRVQSVSTVDNATANSGDFNFFSTSASFDSTVKLSAQFASCSRNTKSEYRFGGSAEEREGLQSVGVLTVEREASDSSPEFPNVSLHGGESGSSNDGSNWSSKLITDSWDGTVSSDGGSTISGDMDSGPTGYAARIFWNGALQETLILKEVSADGTASAG